MKIKKLLGLLSVLFSENPPLKAAWFSLHVLINRESIFLMSVHGFQIYLRSNRTDIKVAFDSLGHEFDKVILEITDQATGVIVDAGGYIGTSAIKFASAFPSCQVYVVEPSTANLEILRKNVEAFDNIQVIEAGISISCEDRVLRDRGTGAWGYTILDDSADRQLANDIETVKSLTFENIWQIAGPVDFLLLKIDIEGGEYSLLEVAETWLPRFEYVVIELHERIVPGVTDLFAQKTLQRSNCSIGDEKILSIR